MSPRNSKSHPDICPLIVVEPFIGFLSAWPRAGYNRPAVKKGHSLNAKIFHLQVAGARYSAEADQHLSANEHWHRGVVAWPLLKCLVLHGRESSTTSARRLQPSLTMTASRLSLTWRRITSSSSANKCRSTALTACLAPFNTSKCLYPRCCLHQPSHSPADSSGVSLTTDN